MTTPSEVLNGIISGKLTIAPGSITRDWLGRRPGRKVDPAVCVAHGGHCWERAAEVLATSPLTYTEHCKHCPAYRRGRQQPGIAWSDPILPTTGPAAPG